MKKKLLAGLATGLLMLGMSGVASANLITNNLIPNRTIIDFNTQPTVSGINGPIQIGASVGENITFSGNPNSGLYTNYNGWGLVGNGSWGYGMTYVSADNARPGSLIFSFNNGPVSTVGGFMNHVPGYGSDLSITAFDAAMNLLESYNITTLANISTPNQLNGGGFRGIARATNDISIFQVSGYVPVLDDLTFSRRTTPTPTPEPATMLLLGSGLAGLIGARRKKKVQA